MSSTHITHSTTGSSLGEILERVLDKGVVIAGDISIALADIELLTIRIRLVVASVDRAMAMGIDWWTADPSLSSLARGNQTLADSSQEELEDKQLNNFEIINRLDKIEDKLSKL